MSQAWSFESPDEQSMGEAGEHELGEQYTSNLGRFFEKIDTPLFVIPIGIDFSMCHAKPIQVPAKRHNEILLCATCDW